ncbi:hypothetical protein Syun_007162 [Stephania yunnanensis]|uniref:Uncharacterized protein n=1 Tax=Stephania yunnanensis TaxID=152371 RepID=A0AAP0KY48_9MAGN
MTTAKSSTKETPFYLAFGAEAVIPIDMGESSYNVMYFNEKYNNDALRGGLDLLEEIHQRATL